MCGRDVNISNLFTVDLIRGNLNWKNILQKIIPQQTALYITFVKNMVSKESLLYWKLCNKEVIFILRFFPLLNPDI